MYSAKLHSEFKMMQQPNYSIILKTSNDSNHSIDSVPISVPPSVAMVRRQLIEAHPSGRNHNVQCNMYF